MGTRSRRKPSRLSEKLVRIREAVGGSQDIIIDKLGFTGKIIRERISEFERGDREPALDLLLAYARLAGVWLDVLVDDNLDLPDKLPASPKSGGVPHKPAPKGKGSGSNS